jgi:hypothetical protein
MGVLPWERAKKTILSIMFTYLFKLFVSIMLFRHHLYNDNFFNIGKL